jgi:DNA replication and repair protein RecF
LIIDRLELFNFKNYESQDVRFSPEINLVTGMNAQGKTNLLESIYFLSHLRSNRAPRLREMIREGEENASVHGLIIDGDTKITIKISFGSSGKTVELNGRAARATRAMGVLKCVMFEPGDLYLVKGEPSRRRDFLDETLEELGPGAARQVGVYRHVLRQRNALLKRWEGYGSVFRDSLEPWSQKLAEAGGEILVSRRRMVQSMQEMIVETYARIAGSGEEISFLYSETFPSSATTPEEATARMMGELERRAEEEKRARTTLVGPHRDDVEIMIKGREARHGASQGEQRTLAFAMRLAQRGYIAEETGKEPVLLLDDVLSELDEDRRRRVLEMIGGGGQAIITATEPPRGVDESASLLLEVERGSVRVA